MHFAKACILFYHSNSDKSSETRQWRPFPGEPDFTLCYCTDWIVTLNDFVKGHTVISPFVILEEKSISPDNAFI